MKKLITIALLFPLSLAYSANDSQNQTIFEMNAEDAISFINNQNKFILTFIGYSGAEYENENQMLHIAEEELNKHLNNHTLENTVVSIGGTPEGIGKIYPLAKKMGFKTLGVVSTEAKKYSVPLSQFSDTVIYVTDNSWGGFLPESANILSPTSQVVVNTSHKIIAIGGGAVGRDEMLSCIQSRKSWKFYFADMNHQKAKNCARNKNLPPPVDFSGETYKELYEKGHLNN